MSHFEACFKSGNGRLTTCACGWLLIYYRTWPPTAGGNNPASDLRMSRRPPPSIKKEILNMTGY